MDEIKQFKIVGASVSGAFGRESRSSANITFQIAPSIKESYPYEVNLLSAFIDGGNTIRWRLSQNSTTPTTMYLSRELRATDDLSLSALAAEVQPILDEIPTLMSELKEIRQKALDYAKAGGLEVELLSYRGEFKFYLPGRSPYDGCHTAYISNSEEDGRHTRKPKLNLPNAEDVRRSIESLIREKEENRVRYEANKYQRSAEARSESAKLAVQTRKGNEMLEYLTQEAARKKW